VQKRAPTVNWQGKKFEPAQATAELTLARARLRQIARSFSKRHLADGNDFRKWGFLSGIPVRNAGRRAVIEVG